MRRILSISIVFALISSSLSPLMAAACTGTGKAMSCHGGATPHCDRSMHEHHHQAAPVESNASLSAAEDGAKCPMDCCTAAHLTNVAAPATASFLPPLAVADRNFHFVSVKFISTGFSSHTDRGPPLA
ncbi:MAG TPA: DUF2946 family protein [Candidatus Angelobacter sp.]